jgi:hypothetical protein
MKSTVICELFVISATLLIFVNCSLVVAKEGGDAAKKTVDSSSPRIKSIPPYCGVQAVCLAARGLGKEVSFADMVAPVYIGSRQGSSLKDLQIFVKILDYMDMP